MSQRIYEIRCRIVHTKAGEHDVDLLLPFSAEARILAFDLELLEFIVRTALIAGSRPLRL